MPFASKEATSYDGGNKYYLSVSSNSFSRYAVTVLSGETENPVAVIGTTGYATLADAVDAIQDGDITIDMTSPETISASVELAAEHIIYLLQDTTASGVIVTGKDVIVDLNGY